MSFYAVRKGLVPGIYDTWDECKLNTSGCPGAQFKKFSTREEAEAFMEGKPPAAPKPTLENVEIVPPDLASKTEICLNAYVDGSFSKDKNEYSYGVILFHKGLKIKLAGHGVSPDAAKLRNVAGEIEAAEVAMLFALNNGYKAVKIYHDYEGIAKWCTGEWKANTHFTRKYKEAYNRYAKKIKISFEHVYGHTGIKFNEEADQLAKSVILDDKK